MNNCFVLDFDSVLGLVSNLPDNERKEIARYILYNLYEKGWDVDWNPPTLNVTKTEKL